MDAKYLPPWRVHRVIRASDTILDFTVRTRLSQATVTVGMAVNGRVLRTFDLAEPALQRGPLFLHEGALDLTGHGLIAGDALTLTAKISDGRVTQQGVATVQVRAGRQDRAIVPGGGQVVTQP